MIRLSDEQEAAIRRHGEEQFPNECCGVMLGDVGELGQNQDLRIVREIRPLNNVHEDGHERRYLVSPDEMYGLVKEERKTGRKILGFYHSHPDHPAQPSGYDRDWALPWYTYIIVSVMGGKSDLMTAWQLEDDRQNFVPEEIETQQQLASK